uniref:Uncharacterized protein n=1 Tax=Vibrio vulnificus TaxID=672 RepID=A0AAI9EM32_VIBVL|nr:hypothetical protein [Vibrio vulnificus]
MLNELSLDAGQPIDSLLCSPRSRVVTMHKRYRKAGQS